MDPPRSKPKTAAPAPGSTRPRGKRRGGPSSLIGCQEPPAAEDWSLPQGTPGRARGTGPRIQKEAAMAAEPSTVCLSLPSCPQMGRKSRPWGGAEVQCTQCGRRVSRVSGEEPGALPRPGRPRSAGRVRSGRRAWRPRARPDPRLGAWAAGSVGAAPLRRDGPENRVTGLRAARPRAAETSWVRGGLVLSPAPFPLGTCSSRLFTDSVRKWCGSSLER